MGYTNFEKELISPYLKKPGRVIDLGSQNDYTTGATNPPFISDWYKQHGWDYESIDMAGDNDSLILDLSRLLQKNITRANILVDAGTGEHVVQAEKWQVTPFHYGYINSVYPVGSVDIDAGFYNLWLNKHNLLVPGGIMFNINPMTCNWPKHGYTYLTEMFYVEIANLFGYEVISIGKNAAMGNTTDGWNIYSVLEKIGWGVPVPSFETFKKLSYLKS